MIIFLLMCKVLIISLALGAGSAVLGALQQQQAAPPGPCLQLWRAQLSSHLIGSVLRTGRFGDLDEVCESRFLGRWYQGTAPSCLDFPIPALPAVADQAPHRAPSSHSPGFWLPPCPPLCILQLCFARSSQASTHKVPLSYQCSTAPPYKVK